VVTADEVLAQRLSTIESGRLGTDAERDEARRLLQAFEAAEEFTLERIQLKADLRDFVLTVPQKAAP
jgi:hypothetical protein